MKNFSTQCATLMMITVMVYAAPTSDPCKGKKLLLEQMKEAAQNAKNHTLPAELDVYKISGYPKKCMEKFFCLARESLNRSMSENSNSNKPLEKLERILNVYSQNETCYLHGKEQYSVHDFLDVIVTCVDYALNNKSSICHK